MIDICDKCICSHCKDREDTSCEICKDKNIIEPVGECPKYKRKE
jgi:hypothetical protein